VAGVSGNGYLDPGERWDDANHNQVLDAGEDHGRFSAFAGTAAVGGAAKIEDMRVGVSATWDGATPGFVTLAFMAKDQAGIEAVFTTLVSIDPTVALVTNRPPELAVAVTDAAPVVHVGDIIPAAVRSIR